MIKSVTRTMAKGVLTFAGGFAVWNIDNIFCTQLRAVRESIGWIGLLLEGKRVSLDMSRLIDEKMPLGHGIWHLMTGYGAFLIFTAGTCSCHSVDPD